MGKVPHVCRNHLVLQSLSFSDQPMIVEYLRNQAARCMGLARACFDLETARQLRLLADDLKAKADEIEGNSQAQSRRMQQQQQQQEQQQQQQDEEGT
jgi:hypothetical protein